MNILKGCGVCLFVYWIGCFDLKGSHGMVDFGHVVITAKQYLGML